jgi:hypothetical protein
VDEVDRVDKVDQLDNVDQDDKVDDVDKVDQVDKVEKVDNVDKDLSGCPSGGPSGCPSGGLARVQPAGLEVGAEWAPRLLCIFIQVMQNRNIFAKISLNGARTRLKWAVMVKTY